MKTQWHSEITLGKVFVTVKTGGLTRLNVFKMMCHMCDAYVSTLHKTNADKE